MGTMGSSRRLPATIAPRQVQKPRWQQLVGRFLAFAVVVTLAVSCSDLFEPAAQAPSNPAGQAPAGSALAVLETLPVQEADNSPPYDREAFGESWEDVDRNGCDTRNDILRRDLSEEKVRDGCVVTSGELADPYTGDTIHFDRSRAASAVQIDHVISLAGAWRTGASEWSDEKRVQFANDPENLLAVDGPENQDKSDDDAAEWLPPNTSYRCPFVARQVGLKARYGLWVEADEMDAMHTVLTTCPDQPVLGG